MRQLAVVVVALVTGCAPVEINGRPYQEVLQEHLTDEAYEAVKDIPCEYGGYTAYAVVNFWSNVASLVTFHGIGRRVVLNEDKLKEATHPEIWLIHEYLHHLDDLGREAVGDEDGGVSWIDIEAFWTAYQAIKGTQENGLLHYQVEKMQDHWITNTFGLGEHSERIAYVGGLLIKQRSAPELEQVYRKVLRKYAR